MKVLSVAGYHKTGKTTLVINLIEELKKRGKKVVSIKDIHNEDFSMDKEGSDSYKHLQTNGETVFARGLSQTYQIWKRRLSLNEMLSRLDADFVIVEGMKSAALPRILCAENEEQLTELLNDSVFLISGKIADNLNDFRQIPVLRSQNEIEKIADLVEEKVFEVLPFPENGKCRACGLSCRQMVGEILKGNRKRTDCKTDRLEESKLKINGKEIKMAPFVQNIFHDTVLGFVKNLKGYEKGKIEITINE
ncbi:MAG: molybdopterin-guanine dinucleotide biosynthesis protein B [Candidatus Cloacimonadota bacterium]|nr:MAG: molybdopterin-guanine dinucleotide biosynthesis protein B [Candidatus Cloacimonadota bacterium]